jgi:hypothetical protein
MSRLRAGLLVVASTYASLLMVDLAVALLLTPKPPDTRGLYQPDAERGHALVPGFVGRVRTTADFDVRINSRGYRDGEWNREPSHRVLVVGDSFTFGEPLEADQSLFAAVTRQFRGDDIGFYNAGVSGYGLAHVLATVVRECPYVRPGLVLYLYYLNDTSWDALRTDLTTVVDGYLVPTADRLAPDRRLSENEIRARIRATLASHRLGVGDVMLLSHLIDALHRRGVLPGDGRRRSPVLSDDPIAYPPEQTAVAADLLRETAAAARNCDAMFTMVILASDWEARLGVREPATERLLAAVAGDGLDILDLRLVAERGRPLRLPYDNHYSPQAGEWAAGIIAAHLRARITR